MKSLQDFFRLGLIALIIGLGVGYALAQYYDPTDSPPTGSGPDQYNAAAPINVGPTPQAKSGDLGIVGPVGLSANRLFATDKIGVGSVVTGSSLTTAEINETAAVLDVNGQIRIRGGSPGADKVLKSNLVGLAGWQDQTVGLTKIVEGFGIDLGQGPGIGDFSVSSTTNEGIIAVWAGQPPPNPSGSNKTSADMMQQRVDSYNGVDQSGCSSPGAVRAIDQTGNATCQNFVTTVQSISTSGLTLTGTYGQTTSATSGPITLAVNVGAGLATSSGKLALNVSGAFGDGLWIDTEDNTVKFETCTAGDQTWKYSTIRSRWECSDFPLPSISMPGESVMYFRRKNDVNLDPALCLTGSGWLEAPKASGLNYTGNEIAGAGINEIRVCYRSDKACQVIYVRSVTASPANCPGSWIDAVGVTNEWTSGGTNNVRTCYICN